MTTTSETPDDAAHVSVVIPTYNAARFAERAIRSAAAQEGVGTVEILCIDDASKDDTVAELHRLAGETPNLKVLENDVNGGPSARRNQGIAAARGAWIAILDADDAFAEGRLARLLGVAEAEGLDAVADLPLFHDLTAGRPEPRQLTATGAVQILSLRDLADPSHASGLDLGLLKPVFRRRLAADGLWHYPEDIRHAEDFALYFRLLSGGVRFGLLWEAHYVFSTRIGAVSGAHSPGSVTRLDFIGVARQAESMARELRADPAADPELAEMMEERAQNAHRGNRAYGWRTLRAREFSRFAAWLRHDPSHPRIALRMVAKKLRGHRGPPV